MTSSIELLAPAKDLETGLAAINCGADAVYIGAAKFGAREAAGNPLADLEKLITHAHKYWAKIYVVVNTLLHDAEIPDALKLIQQVYQSGADALIIQDVGLLEFDLPPIPLFASTQMHNNTPERVAFLEKVGIQRAILARELSLEQIRAIRAQTTLELELFIHGALCVCYSGQCYLSYGLGGRSGNRGQCAQPCRRRYSLVDANDQTLVKDRYLLSIKDLNHTAHLGDLISAGVTSFKIEGRLKDKAYVMNTVGHYRRALDVLLAENGRRRTSSGQSALDFEPDPGKTFNRGFTSYFLLGRSPGLDSNATPKMVGEPVGRVLAIGRNSFTLQPNSDSKDSSLWSKSSETTPKSGDFGVQLLHNGDGLSFFDRSGELQGTLVNRVEGNVISPAKMDGLEKGTQLYRNHNHVFISQLEKSRTTRKIRVELALTELPGGYRLQIRDEDGVTVTNDLICEKTPAEKPEAARATLEKQLAKLGETEFECGALKVATSQAFFIPVSGLNELRRGAVEALRAARLNKRPVATGGILPNVAPFPAKELTYLNNVLNQKAAEFYRRHGVTKIEPAAESGLDMHGRKVMTTKYCLKYQLGHCPREGQPSLTGEPLYLIDENNQRLRLKFDCKECVMEIVLV